MRSVERATLILNMSGLSGNVAGSTIAERTEMASGNQSPTVRLRRLGHEMRRLREAAGKSIHETSAELEWSTSKISRLENGLTKRPDVQNIRVLCAAYGVTDSELIEDLVKLARDARQRGWWTKYQDIFRSTYVGLEAEASAISTFELALIPGLLQTTDYMREVMRACMVRDPVEVERRVEARLERQALLTQPDPPRLRAIIDESALLRPVGSPDVHKRQLRKLMETESLEHVKMQILPFSAGAHAGMTGSFVILAFPEAADRSVVYQETATDSLFLEQQDQINRYELLFEHLCASALSVDASIAYVSAIIDRL
ncbi:helix-turn-helix transcriptional regulator [Thermopolyspora sp. NPDC052614]|uniref:helix-turn-helix domain-containing protein n=1 Tax=Thermopolyspora sp. NPDC052614 TaxID=3155682 RepID=UPI0034132E1E